MTKNSKNKPNGKGPSAPTATPKPGKKKKEKVAKIDYPGLLNDKGEVVRLTVWPEDFDSSKHKGLKKAHFECESIYLFKKADEAEARAKSLREQAEDAKTLGSSKDAAKSKKLKKYLKQAEELKAQLAAAGVDVEKLLAADEAKEAEAAAE